MEIKLKQLCLFLLYITCVTVMSRAEEPGDSVKFSYMPEIHGVARVRWEQSTVTSESHFQIPNARISIGGKVAPTVRYYFNFGYEYGSVKVLDAYAAVDVARGVALQAGQFRMPFGMDSFRGPATYIFNNRSFMGKYVANVRAVGFKAGYTMPVAPLVVEAGVFNPTVNTDQVSWVKTYAYAAKAVYRPGNFKMSAGFMSLKPEDVRINLVDASLGWSNSCLEVEAEYMRKHYTHAAARPVNAYNMYASWALPVKAGVFNRWSVQGRFDAMTAHWDGKNADDGTPTEVMPTRSRATIGSTLSYVYRKVHADVRINYEKYFYGSGGRPQGDQADRLSLELVVAF